MGILVPIAIFFGLTVIVGGAMSQMAVDGSIADRRNPD
jgi:hypothetical protein